MYRICNFIFGIIAWWLNVLYFNLVGPFPFVNLWNHQIAMFVCIHSIYYGIALHFPGTVSSFERVFSFAGFFFKKIRFKSVSFQCHQHLHESHRQRLPTLGIRVIEFILIRSCIANKVDRVSSIHTSMSLAAPHSFFPGSRCWCSVLMKNEKFFPFSFHFCSRIQTRFRRLMFS